MVSARNSHTDAVIGMDLGGTKLSGALLSIEGEPLHRIEGLLDVKEGNEVGALVREQLHSLMEYATRRSCRVRSVGICVPGISNQNNHSVWAPNIPGWTAYPLYSEITESLNNPNIQVHIESDRNCCIMGEIWKGNARNCNHAIFMAVGTGIGIGMVSNGHLINGLNGIAGAMGWLAIDRPFSQDYESCGQLEYYASGTGIARNAERLLSRGVRSDILKAGKITAREVFLAYERNDPVAIKVLDQCIEYWGMAVANLVSLLNPEKIIFGGGVFGPAIQLLDRIRKEAGKWAQPIGMQQVKLEASMLKGDAGLFGAGYMAINNILKP